MCFFSLEDSKNNNIYSNEINQINNTYKDLLKIEQNLKTKDEIFKIIKNESEEKLFYSFFLNDEINNKMSETNKNLLEMYFKINFIYEKIIKFILKLNNKNQKEINLKIIKNLLETSEFKISELSKHNILNLIKLRNSISHTIFFKFYTFYIMSNSENKKIFDKNIKYEEIENKYKSFFNNLKSKDYEILLNHEFELIKDLIKKIKRNEISKTTFIERIEMPLINIYQALTAIHLKLFSNNNIKKTIYENKIFDKKDMYVVKFLHDFKHHTTHQFRYLSDQYKKYNLIKKLFPPPEYKRNKRRQKQYVNLINLIKNLFTKFEEIEYN